ncbi:MAG: hypothetical protein L6R40_008460 [Gallowayella cf. fulva]|nr:MAG: hypothetical protein L6R40_008460 [Xanthomendoza cf. fulva]
MVSRSDKEKAKPLASLAVAQRCKPMKVAKAPRKPRTHKVKQGAPPKLSVSQKRKLVRLYVFTNLSWKSISALVLHFGSKNVEKRALQYVLQGFFSLHYNQMRPRDVNSKRKRMSQVRKLRDMRMTRSHQNTMAEALDPPARKSPHQPTQDHFDHINYPNEFDFLLGDLEEDQNGDAPGRDFMLSNFSVTAADAPPFQLGPTLQSLTDSSLSENANISTNNPSSTALTEFSSPTPSLLDLPSFGTCSENYSPELTFLDCDDPYDVSLGLGLITPAADPLPNLSTSPASLRRNETGPSRPRESQRRETQKGTNRASSRRSDLGPLIDRLPKSSPEKSFIIELLDSSSNSSTSPITPSIDSYSTMSSVRKAGPSDTQVPAHFMRSTSYTRHPVQLAMPGDFITSKINTFSHHICCTAKDRRNHRSTYCDGCCMTTIDMEESVRLRIPFTIMQYKRGLPLNLFGLEGAEPWVDRFGNTALHMAAAWGANYHQLRGIVQAGVSVHEVNSAAQTFMHVLDTQRLTMKDMFSLRRDLEQQKFDFRQLDVCGQTFVDCLPRDRSDPVDFARCWLEHYLEFRRLEDHNNTSNSFIHKLFIKHGGSREQWKELEREFLWNPDRHPAHPHQHLSIGAPGSLSKLLNTSIDSLGSYKHYRGHRGRSCLHDAVDSGLNTDFYELRQDDFVEQARRLQLVKDLLSAGYGADDRDDHGETPLMLAIRALGSHNEIIEELLASGANVDARNANGEAALHISVKLGDMAATRILLSQGANVYVRDSKGRSVLAVGEEAQHRAKTDGRLYAGITACFVLAMDAGAITSSSLFDEWDMPKVKSPYQSSQEKDAIRQHSLPRHLERVLDEVADLALD